MWDNYHNCLKNSTRKCYNRKVSEQVYVVHFAALSVSHSAWVLVSLVVWLLHLLERKGNVLLWIS